MYLKSTKKIAPNTVLSKAHCINVLLREGLTITDKENLLFTEQYNSPTHGHGRSRAQFTLLRGQLKIDGEKSVIRWRLKIDGLVFKTFLLFAFSFSLLKFLIEIQSLFSFVFSGFIALLLCLINIVQLENRVNAISKKLSTFSKSIKP